MKTRLVLLAMAIVSFSVLAGCATAGPPVTSAPLPEITIVPADPNLPAAKFLGKWFGRWDDSGMDHYLVVTKVMEENNSRVLAIYSWGGLGSRIFSNFAWVEGEVKGDVLSIDRNRTIITYKMRKDGLLSATYSRAGNYYSATLKRVE